MAFSGRSTRRLRLTERLSLAAGCVCWLCVLAESGGRHLQRCHGAGWAYVIGHSLRGHGAEDCAAAKSPINAPPGRARRAMCQALHAVCACAQVRRPSSARVGALHVRVTDAAASPACISLREGATCVRRGTRALLTLCPVHPLSLGSFWQLFVLTPTGLWPHAPHGACSGFARHARPAFPNWRGCYPCSVVWDLGFNA